MCGGPVMSLTDVARSLFPVQATMAVVQVFSVRLSNRGLWASPGILFIPLACWDKPENSSRVQDWTEISAFFKKRLYKLMVWILFFALWGQGWNKREVIYSSLIGTTLPLLPYLSTSGLKEWLHDFSPSESQETDVSGVAFSVQDRKHSRESARWHFVCLRTCSSVDLWSVSPHF